MMSEKTFGRWLAKVDGETFSLESAQQESPDFRYRLEGSVSGSGQCEFAVAESVGALDGLLS